jgi:hypothetical protein
MLEHSKGEEHQTQQHNRQDNFIKKKRTGSNDLRTGNIINFITDGITIENGQNLIKRAKIAGANPLI